MLITRFFRHDSCFHHFYHIHVHLRNYWHKCKIFQSSFFSTGLNKQVGQWNTQDLLKYPKILNTNIYFRVWLKKSVVKSNYKSEVWHKNNNEHECLLFFSINVHGFCQERNNFMRAKLKVWNCLSVYHCISVRSHESLTGFFINSNATRVKLNRLQLHSKFTAAKKN